MKKIVSMLMAVSVAGAMLPGAAFVAEAATVAESFTYEENFDTMADGSLPEGWTLYRNKSSNATKTIAAQIKNGALEITDNNQYSNGYLVFDIPELQDVQTQGLTMECDVTLGNSLGITGDNTTASDMVGFAYGFDESKIDSSKVTTDSAGVNIVDGGVPSTSAFKVLMYTNKGEDTTNQTLLSEKFNQNTVSRSLSITSDIAKINTAETEQKMKLKIAVSNTNYHPAIYLNGNQVTLTGNSYVTPDRTSGKLGLYIRDTAVTIDNIKITGKRNVTDSLTVGDTVYDSTAQTLDVPVTAVNAQIAEEALLHL